MEVLNLVQLNKSKRIIVITAECQAANQLFAAEAVNQAANQAANQAVNQMVPVPTTPRSRSPLPVPTTPEEEFCWYASNGHGQVWSFRATASALQHGFGAACLLSRSDGSESAETAQIIQGFLEHEPPNEPNEYWPWATVSSGVWGNMKGNEDAGDATPTELPSRLAAQANNTMRRIRSRSRGRTPDGDPPLPRPAPMDVLDEDLPSGPAQCSFSPG